MAGKVEQAVSGVPGASDLQVEQTDGQTQMLVIPDDSALARFRHDKRDLQKLFARP
jgi:Cu/Ag efflux pump CusA